MYKYLVILSLFALSACTLGKPATPAPEAPVKPVTKTEAPADMPKNAMVSLNYTLREGSPTGNILETTVEDVAKANNMYQSGSKYTPFEVVLGTNSVIPGFEGGIASMKKGEKKVIEVLPKDGYGEASIVRSVKEGEVAPEFTITTDKSRFQDTVVETVARSVLGEEGVNITVGKTLTGGANVVAKVTKVEGDNITLSIDNKDNPFYGKKLAVGATSKKDNIEFTIRALTETGVTLFIKNGDSPFAGKAFVVGATAPLPASPGSPSAGEMKIVSISGETVELSMPNLHPLAGKTLYFEVEVLDIK